MKRLLACGLALFALAWGGPAFAEGSRTLYPATYDALGRRAALDLQSTQVYLNRVRREGFHYVYAEAGEYILLASSNRANNGDISVFNPQDFGTPGDETIPATADFTCSLGSSEPGTHYFGAGRGVIGSRAAELAGPRALTAGSGTGYSACGYQVPETGIYGVRFGRANTGGGPNGNIGQTPPSTSTAEAWEIVVRQGDGSTIDINGRVFTYAFLGFTGGNNRPVFHTLYYVTRDGYRYRQDLRGLDPNGYALYANTFGFLDDNQPLYKTLRGDNFLVTNIPLQVTTQTAQYPIFYSDIMDPAVEPEAEKILTSLGIPLVPPSPTISNVSFSGVVSGSTTATGAGGDFTFDTTGTVSYEIVISRDGINFDAANPSNRVLTGIAFAGSHQVTWDGLDNAFNPFPPGNYDYRAAGRAGEVHFPIIDAENNDTADSSGLPGGGPTIERLNGLNPGDTTVFFDDRGYVTSSGEAIGILNGDLCGGTGADPASPPQALGGVDSLTSYRQWEGGGNANSDCAPTAGWGDAKAVNLWTYFLTPDESGALDIVESTIDLATTVVAPDSADTGDLVQGTLSFSNFGTSTASNVIYQFSLSPGLGTVTFGNLPAGWSAVYDDSTGTVAITPASTSVSAGESFSGITFSYTAPVTGPVVATSQISSSTDVDDLPANNVSSASTAIGAVDVSSSINGVAALVEPGGLVSGAVVFSSVGVDDADGVNYSLQIGTSGEFPTSVTFSNLPGGAAAIYDPGTGSVSFTGLPSTLLAGDSISLNFEFAARIAEGVSYPITSSITTTDTDANPSNDSDSASVVTGYVGASILVNATPVCEQDAPYLAFDVTPVGFTPNNLVTVEFLEIGAGTVLATYLDQPVSGGRVLWPGAAVDGGGNGIAWPGWTFSGGVWSQVPSPARPEVEVRFSLNPTESVIVQYPGPTPGCVAEAPPGQLVDLSTQVNVDAASVAPGATTGATVTFANAGPTTSFGTNYALTIGSPGLVPTDIVFTSLPAGATAMVDAATGVVTFTGMPDTLLDGGLVSVEFSFTAPLSEGSVIDVVSEISGSVTDSDTTNNDSMGQTELSFGSGASISIDAASVCELDAPYVTYDISAQGFVPNDLATVRFIGSSGALVQELVNQPLTGGRLLWPEAAVDSDGRGVAWPGWQFTGGQWIQVPSLVRPEMTVEISVNPTNSVVLFYPPATPDCNTEAPPARQVDVAATVSGFAAEALAGEQVSGAIGFANTGPNQALDISYTLTVGAGGGAIDDVEFLSLPAGVTASLDATSGEVSLMGMPTELDVGESLNIEIRYTMPDEASSVAVAASISTVNPDSDPGNNTDDNITSAGAAPGSVQPVPVPATPPMLLLMLSLLMAGYGARHKRLLAPKGKGT